jgi:hypothetical protein
MNVSRRFFLGGAISLVAAQTFIPSVSAMMNMPTIYGDGRRDDSSGLAALFRNYPVTFNKEQIGVESHEGIIFHNGWFAIYRTVEVPAKTKIVIEHATFVDHNLELPFFLCEDMSGKQFDTKSTFVLPKGKVGFLVDYKMRIFGSTPNIERDRFKNLPINDSTYCNTGEFQKLRI